MGRARKRYTDEFREQMVRLVRTGRTPQSLSREFEASAQTIRNWVKQSELDEGSRTDGLKTEEREELTRLRRQIAKRTKSCSKGSRRFTDSRVRRTASRGFTQS